MFFFSYKHLKPFSRAVSSSVFQHGWPERESNSQPGSIVAMLYQDRHSNVTHCWTFDLLNGLSTNDTRPAVVFRSWVMFVFFFFWWMFCCTRFDSGLSVWLTVICFVSWWWRPVIDGRDPGHLRSTAVDSFEIESSSRSVTMSSLRFWLGRQPSTPQRWGDFMNFNWGHKCERTWKLRWGEGKGSEPGIQAR